MIVNNLPDITGDGAAHPLVTDSRKAKFLVAVADPANGAPIRMGGVATASNVGIPIAPGAALTFPTITDALEVYPMAKIYYFAASGDKLYVEWVVDGSNV